MHDEDNPVIAKTDRKDNSLLQSIQNLETAVQRMVNEDTFGEMARGLIKYY